MPTPGSGSDERGQGGSGNGNGFRAPQPESGTLVPSSSLTQNPEVSPASSATNESSEGDSGSLAEVVVVGTRVNSQWKGYFESALPWRYRADYLDGRPIPYDVDNLASRKAEWMYGKRTNGVDPNRSAEISASLNAGLWEFTPLGPARQILNGLATVASMANAGLDGFGTLFTTWDLNDMANTINSSLERGAQLTHLNSPVYDPIMQSMGEGLHDVRSFVEPIIKDEATTMLAVSLESFAVLLPFARFGRGAAAGEAGVVGAEAQMARLARAEASGATDFVTLEMLANEARAVGGSVEAVSVRSSEAVYAIRTPASASESPRTGAQAVVANADEFVGPVIGRSAFKNPSQFADALEVRYQGFVDDAYIVAERLERQGLLRGNANTRVGDFVDRVASRDLKAWLRSEGIPEGPRAIVQVNRWLRDPSGSGLYVRPDVRIPAAGRIFDATVGYKPYNSPQIVGFRRYSGGDQITIVRPATGSAGGSYSITP